MFFVDKYAFIDQLSTLGLLRFFRPNSITCNPPPEADQEQYPTRAQVPGRNNSSYKEPLPDSFPDASVCRANNKHKHCRRHALTCNLCPALADSPLPITLTKPLVPATRRMLAALATLLLALLVGSCGDQLNRARPYVLTTATTGGTYYPVGVALATIAHAQLADSEGISLTAISSAGSLENVKLLRDNQAQFALLQGPFGAWSWAGEGPVSNPQTHMRSVAAMWQNVEHFVLLTRLTETGTMDDLANLDGERYVLGARNSGAEQTGRFILDTLGINYQEKFNLAYMGYGPTTSAIQDGNIVGMNIPAGAPVSSITQAYALLGDRMTILNWTQESLDRINSRYPLWDWYEFPRIPTPTRMS